MKFSIKDFFIFCALSRKFIPEKLVFCKNLVFYKNWHLQTNQKEILKASSELVHAKTSTLKRDIMKYLA